MIDVRQITESPAIPAPRELEIGDTVLRTIAIYSHDGAAAHDGLGTYAATLTLTMANLHARIWIWRADIEDPTYPHSKRTFIVRMHDDRIPEGASAHEDHFLPRCVHGALRHCLTYPER